MGLTMKNKGNKVMCSDANQTNLESVKELFSNINQHQTTFDSKGGHTLKSSIPPAYIEDRLNNFARELNHPLLYLIK